MRRGRLGVTAAAGGVGGGPAFPLPSEALGLWVWRWRPGDARVGDTDTPSLGGGAGERWQYADGRGGGVPGLAVPCAARLGRPARRPRVLLR